MQIKMPVVSPEGKIEQLGERLEEKRFTPKTEGSRIPVQLTYEDVKVGEVFILDGVEMRKLEGGARRRLGKAPRQLMKISQSCLVGRKVTVI